MSIISGMRPTTKIMRIGLDENDVMPSTEKLEHLGERIFRLAGHTFVALVGH